MKIFQQLLSSKLLKLFVLIGLLFTLQNCDVLDTDDDDDAKVTDTLFVVFVNDVNSVAPVYYFSYQAMGKAGDAGTPSGNWSNNVIPNNTTVAPGGSVSFTLKIPNTHFARYRLGIVDTLGNKILLHEQPNYQEPNTPVTHWGADTRTISTRIMKSETTGNYYTSGYSDWAGID